MPKNKDKRVWFKRISIRDGLVCRKCGQTENLTLEHKIPRCVGGKYSFDNLEILCLKCNMNNYHELVKKALKFYFNNIIK
jgi:5-methylcytosine-specific restriction endonuclease McrA